MKNKQLATEQASALLKILKARFERNEKRHPGIKWADVQKKLEAHPEKLWSLNEMEETGGEPDVVKQDKKSSNLLFFDCATESPKGRRNTCYDQEALDARKEHKPKNSAIKMADEMGIEVLSEDQYRFLQELGEFDLKTSSWVLTSPKVRDLGGAFFCDRRYDQVFTYHNGAISYYAARGFRGVLKV